MANKEDVLEQIVEAYLIHRGYFVRHNIKYRPSDQHPDYDKKADSVHSDIDVIGYHPEKVDEDKVMVVSCKSWQNGFSPTSNINNIEKEIEEKKKEGRTCLLFRELAIPKWTDAFHKEIEDKTRGTRFTYVTAVTLVKGRGKDEQAWKDKWVNHERFRKAMGGNSIEMLTLRDMITEIQAGQAKQEAENTRTPAPTDVGRLLQLISAAKMELRSKP